MEMGSFLYKETSRSFYI